MTFELTYEKVTGIQKGAFTSITYKKEIPVLKEYVGKIKVEKISKAIVRFGVVYDNIQRVVEKRAQGILPEKNAGLSWGQWKVPGYFIEHKNNIYLRCTLVPGNIIQEQYIINGKPSNERNAKEVCQKSVFRPKDNVDVIAVNINNILEIG